MQPRLEATLADFVPALRFLSPDSVDRHLGHPELPPAWWTSVPISRAVEAIGATELPNRLADLAYAELRHLRLGDLLPAAWLARNDFRLSQWPDGVRTNVLVRTPDWGDLLSATVQEIGDWTQVGTSTVRPVISQLFAEVLGLLPPAAGEAVAAPATPTDTPAPEGRTPRGVRIGKRPGLTPPPIYEDGPIEGSGPYADAAVESGAVGSGFAETGEPEATSAGVGVTDDVTDSAIDRATDSADDAEAAFATGTAPDADPTDDFDEPHLEPVTDLVDAIEDELRPVSMPPPPTGDLGAVVRWLAEEAPDVPLMSELARVTLETVAVVGIESATPEVRTALLRLTSLVPETLLPEGLDVSADAFAVDGADLEDPYDAPEMTAILGGVHRDEESDPFAGPEDLTVLAMPTAPREPEADGGEASGSQAVEDSDGGAGYAYAEDSFGDAYDASYDETGEEEAVRLPVGGADADNRRDDYRHDDRDAERRDDGRDALGDVPESIDAFGDVPPETREDHVVAGTPGFDAMDAFGEVPPATREDLPAQGGDSARPQAAARDAAFADPDAVDAFGEVPPSTRDDVPIMGRTGRPTGPAPAGSTAGEPSGVDRAADFEPTVFQPKQQADDVTALVVPSWQQSADDPGGAEDVTVEVDPPAAKAAAAGADAVEARSAAEPHAEPHAASAESAARAGGIVIPPRPSAPPPIPPRPTSAPPTPPADEPSAPAADSDAHGRDAAAEASEPAPAPTPGNIVMVLAAWFTGREPRWRSLARDRMFTDSPRELSSLANEFGKDSAEVEALERALRRHLENQLEQPGGVGVRAHLQYVQSRLGPVATVAELRELDPRHTATVPGLGVQLWQVVRGLLDLNTSADGWLTAGRSGELESRTAEIVGAAYDRTAAPVPLSSLEPPLSALGVRPEVRDAWVARLDGFEVADGFVRPWPADESGPVETAATVEAARPSGQPAPAVPDSAAPHEAPHDAPRSDVSTPDVDPGDAARCFRDDQGVWWYRVDVDMAQLDGERVPLPPEFVLALGLRPGDSLRLHHASGPAALRWENEPYCVSLRTILTGLGAENGDMVFIGSVRPGRVETRLLAGDGKLRLPRWARALRHTGVDPVPDQVNLPALLGARLGLPDGCDLKAVLKRLQDRGDTDVLELLGVAQAR